VASHSARRETGGRCRSAPQIEPPELQSAVAAILSATLPAEQAAPASAFAAEYLRRLNEPGEINALAHEVLHAFSVLAARRPPQSVVEVFDPDYGRPVATAAVSVLETSTEDVEFLVDSITEELRERGLRIRHLVHPVLDVERTEEGRIERIGRARRSAPRESMIHVELDRRLGDAEKGSLRKGVCDVLGSVQRAHADRGAMRELTRELAALVSGAESDGGTETGETAALIRWLDEERFILLGACRFEFSDGRLLPAAGSGLGILSGAAVAEAPRPTPGPQRVRVAKTDWLSPVHRRVWMDRVDLSVGRRQSEQAAQWSLLGLFTRRAQASPVSQIPVLRAKLRAVLDAAEMVEGSHEHRSALEIFDGFPLHELFVASAGELESMIVKLLETPAGELRLVSRPHLDGRGVSLVLSLPPGLTDASHVARCTRVLTRHVGDARVETTVALGASGEGRLHLMARDPRGFVRVRLSALLEELVEALHGWNEKVRGVLATRHGEQSAQLLVDRWGSSLPESYRVAVSAPFAAADLETLEQLNATGETFSARFQPVEGDSSTRGSNDRVVRLAICQRGERVELSSLMPILESLGLWVHDETSWALADDTQTFLHHFTVSPPSGGSLATPEYRERASRCIAAAWQGETETDALNELTITAALDWEQVQTLRAYRAYRRQVGWRFSEERDRAAFLRNPDVTADLSRYFAVHLEPDAATRSAAIPEARLLEQITERLAEVGSLEDDRILRDQLALLGATLRTNAFVPERGALAIKLRGELVPDVGTRAPSLETFVFSPEMEGVHLRGARIARGGVRLSERSDYRAEALSLMRAQMTKNALIVPAGAKGAFVLKPVGRSQASAQDVQRQYRSYVSALLDITDNRRREGVVTPTAVRARDGEDAYLVLAADKGTADFSDIANEIALERGYWLGDAFASGGSSGYNHKALGITARGAWESVRRHFRELGIDADRDPITVAGIGDMRGDVFGNAMLLSGNLRLVAAYDHRHVFVDPDPDPALALSERRRLFELPGSCWADYSEAAISTGGHVWPRSAKSVSVSPEARGVLGTERTSMTPDELISCILSAPVDMLYNGGIGTVVKASEETHEEVEDRDAESIRVDASRLRCRVVVEGGNLGFTQRARVQFAGAGGRIHTDFVDNSGGVDCSDQEVNIKLLLDMAVQAGRLKPADRREALRSSTGEVVRRVLVDSYQQSRIISLEAETSAERMDVFEEVIERFQAEGWLDRRGQALPSREDLRARQTEGHGMRKPELAVLMACAKESIAAAVLGSDLPEDPHLARSLHFAFPPPLADRFSDLTVHHPLRRELIATTVANDLVGTLGLAFPFRLTGELARELVDVIRGYLIAREVTGARGHVDAIDALAQALPHRLEMELLLGVDRLVDGATRFYTTESRSTSIAEAIGRDRPGFEQLKSSALQRGTDQDKVKTLSAQGLPLDMARLHTVMPELSEACHALAIARSTGRDPVACAEAMSLVGRTLEVGWMRQTLHELPTSGPIGRRAAQSLEDELVALWRTITEDALAGAPDDAPGPAVGRYLERREERLARLADLRGDLQSSGPVVGGHVLMLARLREILD
jgi:glutamate dehydrogenase